VGGKPNCSQWAFESSSSEGWQFGPVPSTDDAAAGALASSTAQQKSGAASLAVPYDNNGDDSRYVEIRVQLCAGGNVLDLTGKHVRWSVRMDPPDPGGYNYLILYGAPGFTDASGVFDFNTDSDGVWDDYQYDTLSGLAQVFGIGFHLQTTNPYSGTIYLDAVEIY
jgi:hypothetical protein